MNLRQFSQQKKLLSSEAIFSLIQILAHREHKSVRRNIERIIKHNIYTIINEHKYDFMNKFHMESEDCVVFIPKDEIKRNQELRQIKTVLMADFKEI